MNETLIPWYKQFWPWALIALPGTVVIASITTLVIAIHKPDALVADDYYKEGMGINRVITRQQRAVELQLHAMAQYQATNQVMVLSLTGSDLALRTDLQLRLVHPTLAQQDKLIKLLRQPDGTYQAHFAMAVTQPHLHWHAILENPEKTWRLSATVSPAADTIWEFSPEL